MGQYNILNLAKGAILKSTHIRHIEDGVFDAHDELNDVVAKTKNIDGRLKEIENFNEINGLSYKEI